MGNVLRNMSQLFSFHQLQLRDTDTDSFISFCPQAQCCFHEFFFLTLKNIPKLVAGLKKIYGPKILVCHVFMTGIISFWVYCYSKYIIQYFLNRMAYDENLASRNSKLNVKFCQAISGILIQICRLSLPGIIQITPGIILIMILFCVCVGEIDSTE